jgi:hypothetical protein
MAAEYPYITFRAPLEVLGTTSELRPLIMMEWSVDIDTNQFSTPSSLASLVMLVNQTTNEQITLEYVGYTTSNRLLTLQPTTDLDRSTRFRVYVDNLVLSTTNRRSKQRFTWDFLTAAGGLTAPSPLDPEQFTVQSTWPTFTWTPPGTGVINYYFELDTRWDFATPDYTATTTASSLVPLGTFAEDTTYYWRVRAYTASATGAWCDPQQFYYGTPRTAHASTRQTWYQPEDFGVLVTGWKNGLSNQPAFPTISITFNSAPAANFEQYVGVWSRAQLPRNDVTGQYADTALAGVWTLSGSTITFVPSVALVNNTHYEVRLNQYMTNEDGVTLGKDIVYYFTSTYTPYYADIRSIRSRFLSAEQHIPDDLINYYIYQVSLEAQGRYYMYLQGQPLPYGNQPAESLVRDSPKLTSYGVSRWVEAAVTYRMLNGILRENLRLVDSDRQLGDYSFKLGPGFIKGMELALKQAGEELQYWEDYLTVGDIPRATSRSIFWNPSNRDYDWSVMDLESRRDDPF